MSARKYQRRESREHEEAPEVYAEHPLFPFGDDEEGFDVSYIQVTRIESSGRQVYGPTCPASELLSELAIQEQYGGGVYVLLARRPLRSDKSKPGGVTKSRKLTLPGRPKPFSSDPTAEEASAADGSLRPQTAAGGGMNLGGGGGFENVLIAMMNMQQQTAERAAAENRESARREAENSKAFMTMFLGMMQNSKADTTAMMSMLANISAQSQNSMMQVLPALIGARGGGPEEMAKFAELFKTLGFAQPAGGKGAAKDDDNSIGAILSNGADVLQGIIALKGGLGGASGPVNGDVGHPALAPPGSAQEMLERMKRGG